MDADPAVSADLVLVALDSDAPRSHPPPALSCHVTRAGPPPVGPVRSTPESMARDWHMSDDWMEKKSTGNDSVEKSENVKTVSHKH